MSIQLPADPSQHELYLQAWEDGVKTATALYPAMHPYLPYTEWARKACAEELRVAGAQSIASTAWPNPPVAVDNVDEFVQAIHEDNVEPPAIASPDELVTLDAEEAMRTGDPVPAGTTITHAGEDVYKVPEGSAMVITQVEAKRDTQAVFNAKIQVAEAITKALAPIKNLPTTGEGWTYNVEKLASDAFREVWTEHFPADAARSFAIVADIDTAERERLNLLFPTWFILLGPLAS